MSQLAKEKNLPCIELFDKMEGKGELLCDGLHFSNGGNELLANEIDKQLEKVLDLKIQFPDWKEKN